VIAKLPMSETGQMSGYRAVQERDPKRMQRLALEPHLADGAFVVARGRSLIERIRAREGDKGQVAGGKRLM
jgi:hypothetical protein